MAALADAVGFRYTYDPDTEQYAGTGGDLVVLAPDGTVSRYLLGVRFEPRDLRWPLAEASEGEGRLAGGSALLLCYRYDPATGTYTFAVIRLLKWLSGFTVLGIAGLVGGPLSPGRGRRRGGTAGDLGPGRSPEGG